MLVSIRFAMAKFLLLVATLLVATAVVAEAGGVAAVAPPPAVSLPVKSVFSIKLILHNVATRPVTFKLIKPVVSSPVVALKNKWTAIAPAVLSAKQTTLVVSVTLQNNKLVTVKKTLIIDLLKHFKAAELTGKKFLVLTAVESWSWKKKYVLITIGEVVVLSIEL